MFYMYEGVNVVPTVLNVKFPSIWGQLFSLLKSEVITDYPNVDVS